MSLVTRCTSCGTLFKVVADQLKISQGWVRCGQCATVFDAQANLVQLQGSDTQPALKSQVQATTENARAEPVAATAVLSKLATHEKSNVQRTDALAHDHADDGMASEIQSFRDSKWEGSGMLGDYARSQVPDAPPKTQSTAASHAEPSASPPDVKPWQESVSHDDEPSNSNLSSDDPTTFSPSPASVAPDSALPDTEASQPLPATALGSEAVAPSFVVQAQRAQRWRSPWMRLGLSLVCLGLVAVLALQIALHDKDRIAAQWPEAKPWLDQLCLHAGCKVQALRRIEAMTVDASSFNRINKNNAQLEAITQSYRLSVTLKNVSALPVALPHVELSLQDAQDITILRRVLSPADLGSSLSALAPSQDMPGSVTLQIDTTQLAGSRIQGYRVLAFYP